ncbi:ABC transporter ATP-binding protein [Geodermatophilus aquaeductus]|uniref:ABC-2 type transport system ATP-binding protein/lipopolysaccharide transport system ATP-binding protein n=1 Tax=Geodermatophilus aquaeductus TaxID=1564161 RepID=A0A521FQR1_9ACTN|nr:ABC transporter ATP-binding protein [Geodermatophilus aquaeductus]SMO98529.1 ABC-2 type transport system ATP-binding protein/lipopolysaccharide transport system ATP-binding protein [Geodermatophilus aquaeductus]
MDRIQVEHVSKRYVLGERSNTAGELVTSALRRLTTRRARSPQRELWSLRDVTFRVSEGESLGIVGRNGAGKSTILKILTRITSPTDGVARTRGRVAALLEVGTGFHPELTGRENVYLNGAILGMTRRDIARRFDSIVEFAGTERFLDTPVKRYSSGMYLRLAFAVAAHLEPDILVVDEILAVGDAEFQRKCLGRMEEAGREGRTIVYVSHDLDSLRSVCSRAMWLEAGRVRDEGATAEVVREYLRSGLSSADSGTSLLQAGPLTVTSVEAGPAHAPGTSVVMQEDVTRVTVCFTLQERIPGLDLAINLTSSKGVRVLDQALSDSEHRQLEAGDYAMSLEIPPVLNVDTYAVGVWFGTSHVDLIDEPAVTSFTLHGSDRGRPGRVLVTDFPLSVERV